jgi:hypothetical protein
VLLLLELLVLWIVRICNSSDHRQSISHACGSSKAVNDLVEELLGSGVLALSQPPMRFMMLYFGTGQGQVDGGSIDKYQDSTGEKSERPMSLPSRTGVVPVRW